MQGQKRREEGWRGKRGIRRWRIQIQEKKISKTEMKTLREFSLKRKNMLVLKQLLFLFQSDISVNRITSTQTPCRHTLDHKIWF